MAQKKKWKNMTPRERDEHSHEQISWFKGFLRDSASAKTMGAKLAKSGVPANERASVVAKMNSHLADKTPPGLEEAVEAVEPKK